MNRNFASSLECELLLGQALVEEFSFVNQFRIVDGLAGILWSRVGRARPVAEAWRAQISRPVGRLLRADAAAFKSGSAGIGGPGAQTTFTRPSS